MSLAAAIFSDSQARVLRWVFGEPERVYHLSELRRLTGLGSGSLQRELNRLADAGLLQSERVGNLRRFHADPSSPVYAELVSLARKTLGIEPILREALQPIAARLDAAWVYGSIAKKSDDAKSDIDLLLVGRDLSLHEIIEVLLPAERELGRKVNPNCYTPAEFARRRKEPGSFVNRVLAQPTLHLLGDASHQGETLPSTGRGRIDSGSSKRSAAGGVGSSSRAASRRG